MTLPLSPYMREGLKELRGRGWTYVYFSGLQLGTMKALMRRSLVESRYGEPLTGWSQVRLTAAGRKIR